MNKPVLFIYRKMKEDDKVSRAKNPKYESMSLEELKANMEKSRQELEAAIHHKNLLEQKQSYLTTELKYDYELERVAMQRAAEIALSYGHTRPDDSGCFTAYPSGYMAKLLTENVDYVAVYSNNIEPGNGVY